MPMIDSSLTPAEIKALAKEAFFWGMQAAAAYETRFVHTQLEKASVYVGKNRMSWHRKRFGPSDHEVTTPNFTVLYGFGFFDLREGPVVIQAPAIKGRYWSVQVADQYARWYAALGNQFAGAVPQKHLILGPTFKGSLPSELKGSEITRAPTDFCCVCGRVGLRSDTEAELAAANLVLDQLSVLSLPDWERNGRKPLAAKDQKAVRGDYATSPRMPEIVSIATQMTGVDLMQLLSLVLNDPSMTRRSDSVKEVETLSRLAKLGLAEGKRFDPAALSESQRAAIEEGLAEGKRESFAAFERQVIDMNGWKLSSGLFSSVDDYEVMGYTGLTAVFSPVPHYSHTAGFLATDAQGQQLDGAHRYTLTFDAKNLPPVTEFWELPVYDLNGYFIDNPINRCAVNSYMYENGDFAVRDGKLTFYIQKDRPTNSDQLRNWLPVAAGPFRFAARFYGPLAPVIDGSYPMPSVVRAT